MSIEAGTGFVDIIPRTDKFLGVLNASVSKSLASATSSATTTSQKLLKGASLGFIALGAAAVAAIGKGIQSTVELAGEVRTLQRVTGQSAESASGFIAASAAMGIGVDQLATGFGLLSKNIVNVTPNFAKYGITVRDTSGVMLPFDDILNNVINKFQTLPEGPQRAAFAMNVFGRSGKALIPILSKGVDGIAELEARAKAMGLVLSQDDVEAAKKLSIAQNELGEAFKGASVAIGKGFIPAATEVLHIFADIVKVVSAVPQPVLDVGFGFFALTGLIAGLVKVGGFFANTWKTATATLTGSAASTTTAAAAQTALTASTGALVTAVEALTVTLGGVAGAADVADAGLVGFGVTESGLIVPTEALTTAMVEQEAVAGSAVAGLGAFAALGPVVVGIGLITGAVIGLSRALSKAHTVFKAGVARDLVLLKSGGTAAAGVRAAAANDAPFIGPGRILNFRSEESSQAKAALEALRVEQGLLLQTTTQLTAGFRKAFASVTDFSKPLLTVDGATEQLNTLLGRTQAGLSRFAEISGVDASAVVANISKVITDPKATILDTLDAYQQGIAQTKAAWADWHDQIVSNLGGAGDALSAFLGKQNVSFDKLTGSLDKQRAALRSFGQDFTEVSKAGGKAAQGFLQFVSENGLQAAGILDSVADKPKKIQQQFFEQFNKTQGVTEDLATGIQKALDPAFKKILLGLQNIVRAIQGLPPITLNADKAFGTLATLRARLAELQGQHTINVDLNTHGSGGHVLASGGIIAGAQGFIAKAPVLVGEGQHMTFAGRGAEAVVPFDQHGIGILAQALGMAMEKHGGGGSSGPSGDIVVHLHQHLDGREISESVTRHQQRRGQLTGRS